VPVVVTAAATPLGRAVVRALRADALEVRAVVRSAEDVAAEPLGVPTAVSDFTDGMRAGAAFAGAHTVVHLDRDLPWDWLLDAVDDSGVVRLVVVLPDGVPEPSAVGPEVVVVTGDPAYADAAVVAQILVADRRR
jgi:uncharacterized protein YbjT (DUF2867 family)